MGDFKCSLLIGENKIIFSESTVFSQNNGFFEMKIPIFGENNYQAFLKVSAGRFISNREDY